MTETNNNATFKHIFVLGLAIKLGGCVVSWHNGFAVGVWGYFIASMLVGIGYIMLNLCVAEMTSIIAFPGGHFGYVRASLGPFWGYMAGMMGLVESVFLLAVSLLKFSQAVREVFDLDRHLEAPCWLGAYLLFMCIQIRGGMALWQFTSVASALTLFSLLIYLFGSIHFIDVNRDAYQRLRFGGDTVEVFAILRLPCWFFVGIDHLPVTSEEVVEASKTIPRAVLSVMAVMFCLSLWLQLAVAGLEPATHTNFFTLKNIFPLSYGFGLIFDIKTHVATAFAIAPTFLSSFGFMFVTGRQFNAMARSGLLPKVLATTFGTNKTPIGGMLAASVIGFGALFVAWYFDPYTLLFRIAISGSCVVYILVLLSFIKFRSAYGTMTRHFTNPLGVPSALVGIFCFALIEVSVLFILPLQLNFHETYGFLAFTVLAIVYYWVVVVRFQSFSEEEQKFFMPTYVINANHKMKRSLKERNKAQIRIFPQANKLAPVPTPPRSSSKLDIESAGSDDPSRGAAFDEPGTTVDTTGDENELATLEIRLKPLPEDAQIQQEEGALHQNQMAEC